MSKLPNTIPEMISERIKPLQEKLNL